MKAGSPSATTCSPEPSPGSPSQWASGRKPREKGPCARTRERPRAGAFSVGPCGRFHSGRWRTRPVPIAAGAAHPVSPRTGKERRMPMWQSASWSERQAGGEMRRKRISSQSEQTVRIRLHEGAPVIGRPCNSMCGMGVVYLRLALRSRILSSIPHLHRRPVPAIRPVRSAPRVLVARRIRVRAKAEADGLPPVPFHGSTGPCQALRIPFLLNRPTSLRPFAPRRSGPAAWPNACGRWPSREAA